MVNLSGSLIAKLAERDENYGDNLIDEINSRIRPPRPVKSDDVYIRAMYIVSDQVNSQGGCFAEEELDHLATLMTDSPVMIGHQRDSLPVARNFMAHKIEIDGRPWVKSYFYWMKEGEGAEDLKNNIDGGIYKECSISFLFNLPECSICGRDIRECRHIPFQEYEVDSGQQEIAHFKYRQIKKVLETSLVFRGAIPDTRITDRLSTEYNEGIIPLPITATHFFKISNHDDFEKGKTNYAEAPLTFHTAEEFSPDNSNIYMHLSTCQPGLCLCVVRQGDDIKIESSRLLPDYIQRHLRKMIFEDLRGSFKVGALLYAVKGKERRNGLGLMQIIESGKHLHRLRLKICDALEIKRETVSRMAYHERLLEIKNYLKLGKTDRIEWRRFQTLSRKEWEHISITEDCRRYNFGLEVLTEDNESRLVRNILLADTGIPAIIQATAPSGRNLLKLEVETTTDTESVKGVIGPAGAGLDSGELVLLSRRGIKQSKNKYIWSLIDILPGCDKGQIINVQGPSHSIDDKLYILRGKRRTSLMLPVDEDWRAITVYYLSGQLLNQGRRFIADLTSCQEPAGDQVKMEAIPLKSVSRSGKLIHFRLALESKSLGKANGFWLQPVLIDGNERFLFYADKAGGPADEVSDICCD
jgi:hypothetical protein